MPPRAVAVVLFTDLVGSTELRARLGEDAAEDVRRAHDRLIGGAVARNRGRLVKNLGDGVMATFGGAADALSAAVAIQQAIDGHSHSTRSEVPLQVRVGVSAGDVVVEDGDGASADGDCFGTAVIEAARVCAAARGGQVLVTEVVRLLAGTGAGHRLTAAGARELKGLPEPVPVHEVAWEPLPAPLLPMPPALTGGGRIFVGRQEEMEHLLGLWKEAAAGERRVALLGGEPGIGKTRLAVEVAATIRDTGGLVLAGRCDEDLGVPYQPFVEALRHWASASARLRALAEADAAQPRLGRHAGELARLVPELPELVGALAEPLRSDPETERYRLFDAVAAWLAAVSADAPVLLVLDDLHWAAKPTLLLLRHVLRSAEPLRLLVVATYRDSDIGRGHPMSNLLAELRREEHAARLAVGGLDTAGVTAFVEATAGHRLENDAELELTRLVWRETEGNPFFVGQVLRNLTESQVVERRAGRWVLRGPVEELGIPEGVRDVIGRRLSRLAETTNRVLAVAAVIGLEFEQAVVMRAAGLDEDELVACLEEATDARLLTEVAATRYRFAHALVRTTLYEELSGARRVVLHRRVAEAIEAVHAGGLDDHLPGLAHHWARTAAPAAETERAIDYATRAGDRALAQLAYDEAAAYYRQGIDLLGVMDPAAGEPRRIQLLIALGEAQRRAGEPAYRDTLLAAARLAEAAGDVASLSQAALANTRGMYPTSMLQPDVERVAVLEAALAACTAGDAPERARLLATLGLELSASEQRERRLRLSDEALSMARRVGDAATLTHVLAARSYTLVSPDTLATRLSDAGELVRVAEQLKDPAALAIAYFLRSRALSEQGEFARARTDVDVADGIATDLGQPSLRWNTACSRAAQLFVVGRTTEAEDVAVRAGRLAEQIRQPDRPFHFATQLLGIRWEQGRLEELEPTWTDLVARSPAAVFPRSMLGIVLVETGQAQRARVLLDEVVQGGLPTIPVNSLWPATMAFLSVLATRLHDEHCADLVHGLIEPYPDQIMGGAPLWIGSVCQYLGMLAGTLGRFDEAEDRFRTAAAVHQRIGAPIWLARTRLEWAEVLLTRRAPGDPERASLLLADALATAREQGLAAVERRAMSLMRS